jgi:hypothetical protein
MAKLSHRKAVERARKAYDASVDAVFALATHGHMKFSECLERAPAELAQRLNDTRQELHRAEQAAIDAGRAWRGSYNLLFWSR